MGNAGSILHGTPAFGRIPLASQVTAADIVGSKGRWTGPWVDVNAQFAGPVTWGTPSTTVTQAYIARLAHALFRKAHFPVDADMTGCNITMQIEGRLGPGDPNVVVLASIVCDKAGETSTPTRMGQSDGTATANANHRSQQFVGLTDVTGATAMSADVVAADTLGPGIQLFPQMRAVLHTFTDAGDTLKANFRSWPTSDGTALTDYCPVGVTTESFEGVQVTLPASEPPPTGYPVVVWVKSNGDSGSAGTSYNNNTSATGGGSAGDQVIDGSGHPAVDGAAEALRQGYAVVSVAVSGINTPPRSSPSAFRRNSELDYSLGTVHDPCKDVSWAIQWVRTFGPLLFDLDPTRVILWGEYDAATIALMHTYRNVAGTVPASSTKSLVASPFPNAVVVRNPEVEWNLLAGALRCPLLDVARTGVATTISAANLGDASTLSPLRQLTLDTMSSATRTRISQIPVYCIADGVTNLASTLSAAVEAAGFVAPIIPGAAWTAAGGLTETGFYATTVAAAGSQTVQFDDTQCYVWQHAVREFIKRSGMGSGAPFAEHSHLHVQTAANIPTAPSIVGLVNSSGSTTDNAANVLALAWASRILKPTLPNKGAQAVFDVELVL